MNDDLQRRLGAADPLADGGSRATPAPSRLDAIKERIVSEQTSSTTRTYRRLGRPVVLGLAAAALIAGAAVATGIIGPATFQAAGDGIAGQPLSAKGSGCAANAAVSVTLDGRPVATTTADEGGLFSIESTIPAGTSLGQHELRSTCLDGPGNAVVQTTTFRVVATVAPAPITFQAAGDGVPGQALVTKGSGCAPGAAVTVTLDGRQVGSTVAEDGGTFDVALQIPAETTLGQHELRSTCLDAAAQSVAQTTTITIVEAPAEESPKTVPVDLPPSTLP